MAERPILIDLPEQLLGERIVLRPLREANADALFEAIGESVEHLRPWMPWATAHQTIADSIEYIRRCQSSWALRENFPLGMFAHEDERFLGCCGLHVGRWTVPSFEIGYWIRRTAEGRGYVTEAARLLTDFAFGPLQAERVVIRCDARNRRSAAVPERLQYRLEGIHRSEQRGTFGELTDTMTFGIIRADYERIR